MKQYFYNDNSISKIRKIEENYRAMSNSMLNIHDLIRRNVCVNGIWYDDNAITFIKWWDSSKYNAGVDIIGDLKWDESKNKLISDTTNVSSDGVERLKKTMANAMKVFYIAICKSLAALESSHKDLNNKCKIYIQKAHDKKYNLKTTKQAVWQDLSIELAIMQTFYDGTYVIPATSNGKTTSLVRLQNFQKEIETQLNKFDECVDNYYKEILTLVNNTDTSKWWGFSDDVRNQVKKAAKTYGTKSDRRIKNFKRNLNLAISKTIEAKGKDLKQIMEADLLSDFE